MGFKEKCRAARTRHFVMQGGRGATGRYSDHNVVCLLARTLRKQDSNSNANKRPQDERVGNLEGEDKTSWHRVVAVTREFGKWR